MITLENMEGNIFFGRLLENFKVDIYFLSFYFKSLKLNLRGGDKKMIYISLENARMETLRQRDLYYSLPLIMPMVLEIGKVVNSLNEKLNTNCSVHVRICGAINLEVKNER